MAAKRYSDDYENVITIDKDGKEKKEAVYRGKYYEFVLDKLSLVKFKRIGLVFLALVAALHIGGGCVANKGMYMFAVALPYVIAFFPLLYAIAGALRLPSEERKFRRDEVGLSFERMKISNIALLICIGCGLLGEIAFLLFMNSEPSMFSEYLYLGLETLVAVVVYFLMRIQGRIHVREISGQ
jgi:hypothetical protein